MPVTCICQFTGICHGTGRQTNVRSTEPRPWVRTQLTRLNAAIGVSGADGGAVRTSLPRPLLLLLLHQRGRFAHRQHSTASPACQHSPRYRTLALRRAALAVHRLMSTSECSLQATARASPTAARRASLRACTHCPHPPAWRVADPIQNPTDNNVFYSFLSNNGA